MYKYALILIKLPKNAKKNVLKYQKHKIKFSLLKYLLHEWNYVLGKYCLRSAGKKCTLH